MRMRCACRHPLINRVRRFSVCAIRDAAVDTLALIRVRAFCVCFTALIPHNPTLGVFRGIFPVANLPRVGFVRPVQTESVFVGLNGIHFKHSVATTFSPALSSISKRLGESALMVVNPCDDSNASSPRPVSIDCDMSCTLHRYYVFSFVANCDARSILPVSYSVKQKCWYEHQKIVHAFPTFFPSISQRRDEMTPSLSF